ncbi:MAG: hypothetical protein AAF391_12625 [Bacteroidota bacterium]
MKSLKNLRQTVCRIAHLIWNNNWHKSWSNCMKAAWIIAKLSFQWKVEFSFYSKSSDQVKTYIGVQADIETIERGFIGFTQYAVSKIAGVGYELRPKRFRIENLRF